MTTLALLGAVIVLALLAGSFACYVWVHRTMDREDARRLAEARRRSDEERAAAFDKVTGE